MRFQFYIICFKKTGLGMHDIGKLLALYSSFSPEFSHITLQVYCKVCVWEVNELFRLREICLNLFHDKGINEKINILKRIY